MASKVKKVKKKTHKAAGKRMKLSGTGKVLRKRAGLGHLCSHKTTKRKRQLRRTGAVDRTIAKTYRRMLSA